MAIHKDPSAIIDREKMGAFQIVAIFLCVLLNAVDGFDVLSISFASPGIASDWGVSRAELGVVLSMELIGMGVGSILIGNLADRFGRRPIILSCILVMAAGMALAAFARGIVELSLFRLMTGLGIGGMLASTNAMVSEYSNGKYRNLSITVMAAGFPIGAVVGGAIASSLLVERGWHSVFLLGAGVTLLLLPVVWLMLPESIAYLNKQRPKNALERINSTLKRMGHKPVEALPELSLEKAKSGWGELFSGRWRTVLLVLTVAYFAHIMTFYFIIKWIPKIVVDMGYDPSSAGTVLVWANVGGAIGALSLGILSHRINVKRLVMTMLVGAAIMVVTFGFGYETVQELALVAAITGFCTNSAVVGMYALIANSLPTEVRAGGTGVVIGIGRGGAALGPIVAGVLFSAGANLLTVSIVMAGGSLLALFTLIALPSQKTKS